MVQEAADRAAAAALEVEINRKQHALTRRRKVVESRIAEMRVDLAAEAEAVDAAIEVQTSAASGLATARAGQARDREQSGAPQASNAKGGRR
jgi:hypothetical protein